MTTRKSDSKGKAPAKKAPATRSTGAAPKGPRPPSKASAPAPRAVAPPIKTAGAAAASAKSTAIGKGAPAAKGAPPRTAPPKGAAAKSAPPKSAPAKSAAARRPTAPAAKSAPSPAPRKPPGPTAPALREGDLKRLEELLLAERQRLLRELGHLENTVLKRSLRETSGELSGYSFHMADVGTDAMEREKAFHFASAEGRALLDVDDALRRLYGNAYGNCESCGNPVGRERLEVVPHARLCVACKQKEERAQSGRF